MLRLLRGMLLLAGLFLVLSPLGSVPYAHAGLSREQKDQIHQVEKKYKDELKALKAQQKQELKSWETNERQARHQFFEENKKGSERRTYIKDFLSRRHELLRKQKEARDELQRQLQTQKHSIEASN